MTKRGMFFPDIETIQRVISNNSKNIIIYKKEDKATFYEHLKYAQENDISSRDKWKKISDRIRAENKLYKNPFDAFSSKFFEEVGFFSNKYCSFYEHLKYAQENEITSKSGWKKLSTKLRKEKKLHFNPTLHFPEEFFEEVGFFADKYCSFYKHLKYAQENEIKTIREWYKIPEDVKNRNKLYSNPNLEFKLFIKEEKKLSKKFKFFF